MHGHYSPDCIIPNGMLVIEEAPRRYTQLIFGAGYFPVGAEAR